MGIPTNDESKSKRFNLRVTSKQDHLIRVAANVRGIDATNFVIESAYEKAHEMLADRSHFILNEKRWAEFMKAPDAPPRIIPEMQKLFSTPLIAESR